MIKVRKGNVEFKGTESELLAEVTCLLRGLFEEGIEEEDILMSIELAKDNNDSEITEEQKTAASNLIVAIEDFISKLEGKDEPEETAEEEE